MKNYFCVFLMFFVSAVSGAHPTGNMIVVGKTVLWPYIHPLQDTQHHACVMAWNKGTEPRVLLRSAFPASDYMLYHQGDTIYLIERRYRHTTQVYEVRILKTTLGEETEELWPWFEDKWRIGEGGFYMVSDHEIVFASYPHLYSLHKGGTPKKHASWKTPVKRIRAVSGGNVLILSDSSCWLADKKGNILHTWDNLLEDVIAEPPLGRNQLFDVDYHKGVLLMAYWGKRAFQTVDPLGNRTILLQQKAPLTPHWVAFMEEKMLLFSSEIRFDGSSPQPHLLLMDEDHHATKVWTASP